MAEQDSGTRSLGESFERLGRNLRRAILTAWEHEQRKQVTRELEEGMRSLGAAVERTATEVSQSEAAQQLKAEVEQVAERLRAGELPEKMQTELLEILEDLNRRLEGWLEEASQPDEEEEPDG